MRKIADFLTESGWGMWIGGFFCGAGLVLTLLYPAPAGADTTAWPDADDDIAMVQQVTNAVGWAEEKYGVGPIVIQTAWLTPGVFAEAFTNGTIVINKQWTHDPAGFEQAVANAVANGYHPGGCNAAWALGLHEYGHMLDAVKNQAPRYQLAAAAGTGTQLQGQLPQYSFNAFTGALDYGEALAGAFQAVECGTANETEWTLYRILVG